jgi:hypothetical protein
MQLDQKLEVLANLHPQLRLSDLMNTNRPVHRAKLDQWLEASLELDIH